VHHHLNAQTQEVFSHCSICSLLMSIFLSLAVGYRCPDVVGSMHCGFLKSGVYSYIVFLLSTDEFTYMCILYAYNVKLFLLIMQYPGVADSINSDINNLVSLLKVWDILPKGRFVHLTDIRRVA